MWLQFELRIMHGKKQEGCSPMQEPRAGIVAEEAEGRVSAVDCVRLNQCGGNKEGKRTRLDITSSRVDVVGREGIRLQNDVEVVSVHCAIVKEIPDRKEH
jgi:hypothetical protein